MAALAAAGISGASFWSTGIQAFRFSVAAFLVPYAFAYNQALLLKAPWVEIAWVVLATALGVVLLAAAVVGYAYGPARPMERMLLLAASLLLITPEKITDLFGIALAAGVLVAQRRRIKATTGPGCVDTAVGPD